MGGWVLLVALAAGAACVPGASSTSITIDPQEVSLEPGADRDFVPALGGPSLFQENVRWTVEPVELGMIDTQGHFHAGSRSGSGTVTASLGGASATAKVTISCPSTKEVREVQFSVRCADHADMYFEDRIPESDRTAITAVAEADAIALERHFDRAFGTRGLIYVFADSTSYVTGIRRIFGQRVGDEATEVDAFFAPWYDAVAIDWGVVSQDKPVTAIRHELSHRLVWRISGYTERPIRFDDLDKEKARVVPTWLDEGLAVREETTSAGAEWLAVQSRVFGAAAARKRSFTLGELTDLAKWNDRKGDDAAYEYDYAAEAVRLLESDIGRTGIVDILERIRKGATFGEAYKAVRGQIFGFFDTALAKRITAGLTFPSVTATSYGDHSMLLFLSGLASDQVVTYTITGPAPLTASERMDKFGCHVVVLGKGYPIGTYTITMTGGGADPKAVYTITKTQQ